MDLISAIYHFGADSLEMTSLRTLHQSMISIGNDMQQFRITTGAASFDCLFSTRDNPFVLTLTSRGEKPSFFQFDVTHGYNIKPYLGDMYGSLVEVLKVDGRSGDRLIPKHFLEQLNGVIPTRASSSMNPSPSEIVRLRPDIIEERDRPYFDTWIYWQKKGPKAENLRKTRLLLGPEAASHSIENNASSRWSASPTGHSWKP